MQWPAVVGIIVIALLLAILPLVWLWVRRRWLAHSGDVFDCSLRRFDPDIDWTLGLGRYSGEEIQWFRIFSLSLSATVAIQRRHARVISIRDPDSDEAQALMIGQRIVHVVSHTATYELAADAANLTALLSWLEAAPPGPERP